MNKNRKMENISRTKTDNKPQAASTTKLSSTKVLNNTSKTYTEKSSNNKLITRNNGSSSTTTAGKVKESINKPSVGPSTNTIPSPSKQTTMEPPLEVTSAITIAFNSIVTNTTTKTTKTPPPPPVSRHTKTTPVTIPTKGSIIERPPINVPVTTTTTTLVSPPQRSNKRSRRRTRAKNQFQIDRIDEINNLEDKLNEEVLSALRSCDEGQELPALCYALTPNPHFLYDISSRVVYDLNYIFSRQFQYFKIFRFGSSMNFLALKNSDFDFYIKIDDMSPEAINSSVSRIIINTMREMQMQRTFTNIVPIFNAKIPLVKCIHKLTGFQCDINFTNAMGVYNTKIIKYFMQYDERIHPLTLILKYWLRTHKLTETCKITNYCLIMLIFFYLQLLNEPILPPICIFQRGIPEINIGCWNVAFDLNFQPIMSRNRSSVMQLLIGFFQYYGNFPFEKLMICPLYARSYNRESFCARIPMEFKRYEDFIRRYPRSRLNQTSPICVQDPFDYSHNVAVRCDNLMIFRNELIFASELCKNNTQNFTFTIAPVLIDLFNKRCPPPPTTTTTTTTTQQQQILTRQDNLYLTFTPQISELELIRKILTIKMNGGRNSNTTNTNTTNNSEDIQIETIDIHRFWCERYHEFLINSIQDIFQFVITNCKTFDGPVVDEIAEEPINHLHKNETIDEHSSILKMIKTMKKNLNLIDENVPLQNNNNNNNNNRNRNRNRNVDRLHGNAEEDADVDGNDDDNNNNNNNNNNNESLIINDDNTIENVNEDDDDDDVTEDIDEDCVNDLIRCEMCVHGIQDVFYLRDYRKPTNDDYQNNNYLQNEIHISRLNFDKKLRAINLHCRLFILTSKDYSTISVLFIDKLLRKRNNGIRYFYNLFSTRIKYYLKAYFCHLKRQYNGKV